MLFNHQKTHNDQIWISESKEVSIVKSISNALIDQGFLDNNSIPGCNYGFPNSYIKGNLKLVYRLVDSLYLNNPEVWNWEMPNTIITDNIALTPVSCHELTVLPEFWHIWYFDPVYQDRPATKAYNCFMNRVSGDRSQIFYELIRNNILNHGYVSYNCFRPGDNRDNNDTIDYSKINYDQQYREADMYRYNIEHKTGRNLIPYNTIGDAPLEQLIIDSNISIVIETYTSDSHIVFSEKIFRALQLPRPWVLYCSPQSIKYLKHYGFDVLDDCVDHSYDQIVDHEKRLLSMVKQLKLFLNRIYTESDYARFDQAAVHNRNLLLEFKKAWPKKFNNILKQL
jgi:hypothetical protein